MTIIIFTVLFYGALTAYEFPRLKKKKEKNEWFVFVALMLVGLTLSILIANHITFKIAPRA
ncbi:hypothetical protein ACFPES_13595 [Paenibacillus sp. GCM10023248]|uniref:hypothetical protein n=1 Tax=Bacillales TaxID=1385 RepID=UPI002379442B|nr:MULTISPECIES: hypothetical protein [Bacillales]MDD9268067.1 hypothetical protein [Paenibacillus sp. MAHUQ-63]MDR6879741.1 4-hydroxybenzoate polyprenyltransferase [Bacillus sp. 3255]